MYMVEPVPHVLYIGFANSQVIEHSSRHDEPQSQCHWQDPAGSEETHVGRQQPLPLFLYLSSFQKIARSSTARLTLVRASHGWLVRALHGWLVRAMHGRRNSRGARLRQHLGIESNTLSRPYSPVEKQIIPVTCVRSLIFTSASALSISCAETINCINFHHVRTTTSVSCLATHLSPLSPLPSVLRSEPASCTSVSPRGW